VTAPDHVVDEVVRIATRTCAFGPETANGRILVMPVEEPFNIGAGRRVA
jgi:hypothetical protein